MRVRAIPDVTIVTLADSSRVLIRPIAPDDRSRLNPGLSALSEGSRHTRFLGPRETFSEAELDYLTFVDHHDHEAILAFDADTGEGVGVARYIRTGRRTAEPAVTVSDEWQGRGLGGRLMDLLAARARQAGVRTFVSVTLAGNSAAIRMLERVGPTTRGTAGPHIELVTRLSGFGGLPLGRRLLARRLWRRSRHQGVQFLESRPDPVAQDVEVGH